MYPFDEGTDCTSQSGKQIKKRFSFFELNYTENLINLQRSVSLLTLLNKSAEERTLFFMQIRKQKRKSFILLKG